MALPRSASRACSPVVIPLVSRSRNRRDHRSNINVVSTDPLIAGQIGGPDTVIPIKISGAIDPNPRAAAARR